jgi:hypothetical protein
VSEHSDFSIAVYLNQAAVFDLLAIIEDGMAQVSTIRTSESKKAGADAGIGASNVFALLGVRLKGSLESVEGREVTHERVHTPTSLFSKVRHHLRKAKLVHDLTGVSTNLAAVRPGNFVEVEVRLRRNPLVDALEAVNETIAGIKVLTSFKTGQKSTADKAQEDSLRQVAEQCKRLTSALTGSGAADLVGEIVPGPGHVIVPVEDRFFGEHSADEVADGQFRVFGKVVRAVNEDGEGISLLRNTKFAHIPSAFDALKPAFAATKQSGVSLPEVITEVKAPALQVMPIAIFL